MKKVFIVTLLLLNIIGNAIAQESAETENQSSIDQIINESVQPFTNAIENVVFYSVAIGQGEDKVSLPLVLVWLIVAGLIFTIYFRFINLRSFKHSFRLIRGDYSNPDAPGEVSHFAALATALSGTVGLGNIAGVAIAVSIGGPGATFWMIVAGFLGMSSKFVECTLGVKYRVEHEDGTVSGGPKYYLTKGLADAGYPGLGKILAFVFAICCIGGAFGGGNMFQANQVFEQLRVMTGGEASWLSGYGWLIGLIMAVFVGIIIIGGIKSIARFTVKAVPLMGVIYVIAGLVVIGLNYQAVPDAFTQIFEGAFSGVGIAGGIIGVLIQGIKRSAFSNEAGIGSAAIAHSAVKTDKPITEGLVALYEPFIDTIVICTITALVIVITGTYDPSGQTSGISLTSSAFASTISWFPYVLTLAVVLFAISTMLSWSYYGMKSWTYLFGRTPKTEMTFNLIFLVFIIIGASMNLGAVVGFSDAMIFAMSVPNIIGLYFLAPKVKAELQSYWADLKSGKLVSYRNQ